MHTLTEFIYYSTVCSDREGCSNDFSGNCVGVGLGGSTEGKEDGSGVCVGVGCGIAVAVGSGFSVGFA